VNQNGDGPKGKGPSTCKRQGQKTEDKKKKNSKKKQLKTEI